MRSRHSLLALVLVVSAVGCDRRTEIPAAADPSACSPVSLGPAEGLASGQKLPVDRVVSLEGMPHQALFGWTEEGRNRGVSKLLGTERRLWLVQDFDGDAPRTSTSMTGLLRRWSDLPATPWDAVKQGIAQRFGWQVPDDAYVLLEGKSPSGCP